ncbi:hypothetical protein L3Y34_000817 [Caenorhabditis briggsae]|uniref:Protein-tyrosine phosphatase catalytic domain-containing protein n=1 Tax=Caenorhabditis briggsae TaxID=6238 RepID=A0AAE9IN60_CAEBR|nr:hypothetical protein L3Y34_000817 [Caenorhabditis briggsae]
MVIQNKVEQIVMLCKTVETGKLKCAQYWPGAQGEKKEFKSGVVVENMSGTKTGTIVAIEYILEKIAENKQCPPMPDLVKQLRDQRAYSIQNDLQYLYIHRVMLNYFLDKYKEKYASLLTRTLQSTRSLSRTTTQQLDSDLFFSFTS